MEQISDSEPETQSVSQPSLVETNNADDKKIFIVHGHDKCFNDLNDLLKQLDLQSYILQNEDTQSDTLINALEQQIRVENTSFGIVLLTPDDIGYPLNCESEIQPRARQNVILELGMLIGRLGRKKIAIFKKGDLEIPSDINGVQRIEFNEHIGEKASKLIEKLKNADFDIPENTKKRLLDQSRYS